MNKQRNIMWPHVVALMICAAYDWRYACVYLLGGLIEAFTFILEQRPRRQ